MHAPHGRVTDKDNHNWVRWQKFAHSEIARTLLFYLSRYKEFDSPELMERAVSLIHRQVVKAKAEGLYFNVSVINPGMRACTRTSTGLDYECLQIDSRRSAVASEGPTVQEAHRADNVHITKVLQDRGGRPFPHD